MRWKTATLKLFIASGRLRVRMATEGVCSSRVTRTRDIGRPFVFSKLKQSKDMRQGFTALGLAFIVILIYAAL
jgi:hypothetical protein